jgi:uncharacterized protein YbcI
MGYRRRMSPSGTGSPPSSEAAAPQLAIADAVVGLYKQKYGRGPENAKTYLSGDVVTVLLRGGFTVVERTLLDHGEGEAVRSQRQSFDDAVAPTLRALVAEVLGRDVVAVMSAVCPDPDMTSHVFVLDPD